MQWIFMVAIVVMVMVAGIMVVVTYKTEVSITKSYGLAENFLNPNIIGFEEKPEIQIKCVKGNVYNFIIKDLKLFYKGSDETLADIRIDLGSEAELRMLPNTPFTIPMEQGIDIIFDYALPDTLEFINEEKILIRLTFWEYGTSKSCYALNRNMASSVLLEKCIKSYLGSVNMVIDKGQFDVGECAAEWRFEDAYGTKSKTITTYLGEVGIIPVKIEAILEGVNKNDVHVNLNFYSSKDDKWTAVINKEDGSVPVWYCEPPKSIDKMVLTVGNEVKCEYSYWPVAKLNIRSIDYNTRLVKIDINSILSSALSGGWSVLPSIFPVDTSEGYSLGSLYVVLTSHRVPSGNDHTHNFVLTVERIESFDNPSEVVCKDVDFSIHMDKDDKYSTIEDCGPYKIKITNVNEADKRLTVDITVPDEIKNIKRGQGDYCKNIMDAKFGGCLIYQGLCNDNDECGAGSECNTITYSDGKQEKICTDKPSMDVLTDLAKYKEWNNNAVTEYMKWKTNNQDYVYTDEGEPVSDSDDVWVYPGEGP